jgi:hypothetical protein
LAQGTLRLEGQPGIPMKKAYEKPILTKRERLAAVAAQAISPTSKEF